MVVLTDSSSTSTKHLQRDEIKVRERESNKDETVSQVKEIISEARKVKKRNKEVIKKRQSSDSRTEVNKIKCVQEVSSKNSE